MIVAGGNYEVVWADVGVNGSVSDDAVLKRSSLGHKLENNELDLPPPKPLQSRSQNVPYVFIGDDAFALQPDFVKPHAKNDLDPLTRICNNRFSQARRISENVFGIVSCRWRVFRTTIPVHPDKVRRTTLGVLTIHNWLLRSKTSPTVYVPFTVTTLAPTRKTSFQEVGDKRRANRLLFLYSLYNIDATLPCKRKEFAKNLKSFLH